MWCRNAWERNKRSHKDCRKIFRNVGNCPLIDMALYSTRHIFINATVRTRISQPCMAWWSPRVPPCLNSKIWAFRLHSSLVPVRSVRVSELRSIYSIHSLVFLMEAQCVLYTVRTESLCNKVILSKRLSLISYLTLPSTLTYLTSLSL